MTSLILKCTLEHWLQEIQKEENQAFIKFKEVIRQQFGELSSIGKTKQNSEFVIFFLSENFNTEIQQITNKYNKLRLFYNLLRFYIHFCTFVKSTDEYNEYNLAVFN